MGVLIKNMEMPKCCGVCFMKGNCNQRMYMEQRPMDCPLIEVPTQHGDLVDRDKLMTDVIDSDLDHLQRDDWKEVIQIVEDAPIIIEAEGSEE